MISLNDNVFGISLAAPGRRGTKSMDEIRATHAHDDDAALAAGSAKGDGESFAALVDRHMPAVYKFTYRYVGDADAASDIVQDVFIKVWKNIKKFDSGKSFTTWLFAIAKNTALDAVKRKKAVLFSKIEEGEDADLDAFLAPYLGAQEMPDEIAVRNEARSQMEGFLARLSPGYRSVLLLRYGEHLKFREIADTLQEPIDTVKSKHRRALIQLRKLIGSTQIAG